MIQVSLKPVAIIPASYLRLPMQIALTGVCAQRLNVNVNVNVAAGAFMYRWCLKTV